MFIKVLNVCDDKHLINSDTIVKVYEAKHNLIIQNTNGEVFEIRNTTLEEFQAVVNGDAYNGMDPVEFYKTPKI